MNHSAQRWTVLIAILAVSLWLPGCERHSHEAEAPLRAPEGRQPRIVVTLHPIATLVSQLTQDLAQVQTLIPPGVSEHESELTTSQVQRLSEADLLIIVGLGLDDWTTGAGRKRLPVLRFADLVGIKGGANQKAHRDDHDHDHAHDHSASSVNPHLWLDPVLTAQFVEALAGKLQPLLPQQEEQLRQRAAALRQELEALHEEFQRGLSDLPQRKLITFHNAFDPLAQRYSLEVVAHLTEVELSAGGEVTPRQLADAIETLKRHELKVVYSEPQFPDKAVQALQQQTRVRVLRLDPLGHPGIEGYQDYAAMMRSNLRTLIEGQSIR